MVSVKDGVEITQIRLVAAIHKDTARRVVLSVDHMVKIFTVVLTQKDGIVDLCIGAVDPADNIGIESLKTVEIDGDRADLRIIVRQCIIRILRVLITGSRIAVLLLTLMVLVEDLPQPESAECDDRGKYNDQNIGYGSTHLIPLIVRL